MTWFESTKKTGSCSQCGAPVKEGDRMWAVRRGYYTCEPCGFLREQSQDSGDMGAQESSVVESLKAFPPEVMGQLLAQSMIYSARLLDLGEVSPRDVPAFQKELRQALAQLSIMFPPEPEGDETDKAQQRRDSAMTGLNEWEGDNLWFLAASSDLMTGRFSGLKLSSEMIGNL